MFNEKLMVFLKEAVYAELRMWGAICALAEKGYEWERVAGTSAGSIIAALLAAGYSCSELKQ